MNKKKFTYKKSGVNINAADNFINFISNVSSKKKGKKKFSNIGGFGSITSIPYEINQPRIVACTDGVGTKIEIANTLNKFDTIGIDLVAMCVNDLIVQGAKPLIFLDNNQKATEKNIVQEIKKKPLNEPNSSTGKTTAKNFFIAKEITKSSPSLEELKNLIDFWLLSKRNYLAGKGQINISNIVTNGLIDRTIEERKNDIKKGIYKEINSQIRKINLVSQTSSRIVVSVELNYLERIIKNSGEFVNETSLSPLKVKYIFGFSNKSWKLVDFVSGL